MGRGDLVGADGAAIWLAADGCAAMAIGVRAGGCAAIWVGAWCASVADMGRIHG
jgi:hypothetical protein